MVGESADLVRLVKAMSCDCLPKGRHQAALLMGYLRLPVLDLYAYSVSLITYAESQPATDIQRECIALQEHLQVGILLEDWVVCDLLYALLKPDPALLHKVLGEPAKRILIRDWRNNYSRIVHRKSLVQPQEVGISPQDGKAGFLVHRGSGLVFRE